MASSINVQPQLLDIKLYAGDGVEIRLVWTDNTGDPLDVNGAVTAQIRSTRLSPDPPITEFSSNLVDAYQGIVILSLTGAQTKDLIDDPSTKNGKFSGVWDIQWTPFDSEPRTLCQGSVECVVDVTR